MTFIILLIILSCSLSLVFSNSTLYIISIILTTLMGSFLMIMNFNSIWLSFLILMLMVGGMMILYIFILSMNSNEKMNHSKSIMFFLSILILSIILVKTKNSKSNQNSNIIFFQNSSIQINFILMIILMTMLFTSKLIFNPSKPSKSMK